jgi:hypothetical protein
MHSQFFTTPPKVTSLFPLVFARPLVLKVIYFSRRSGKWFKEYVSRSEQYVLFGLD